jgi:hypothetical protein
MNRQLRADGGIMQVAPREKFGLGSKLKDFVRKIIPNEIADIAVKAAPFVAPFNPAVGAAMSGLGRFDQTGSIGDSLKGGALTYGLGQGARYLGGAGFQGNPFAADGGAFRGGFEGFTQGFSSPLGTDTGLGKFFSNRGTQGVEGVDYITSDAEPVKSSITETFATADSEPVISKVSENILLPKAKPILEGSPNQMTITQSIQKILSPTSTPSERGNEALNLLKRGTKAAFTKTDAQGNTVIDKAAVMGAVTFAASYAEAKALAADAGVEITEEVYDEAKKADKKEEYAGYLTNFFAGKKDGGRIGFESGANEMIKTQLLEEIMPNTDTTTEDYVIIMTEDGPRMILKSNLPSESMMMDTTTSVFGDAGRGREIPQELRANGGRIGFKKGSPEEPSEVGIMAIDVEAGDDDEENMMMAGITFSRPEKSYLFRKLGGAGGADRSFTMPQLYRILNNPNRYPDDAAVLKEIAIMGLGENRADGGRIGFSEGMDEARQLLLAKKYTELLREYSEAGLTDADSRAMKEANEFVRDFKMADGGRIGYKGGANRVSELLILRDEKIARDEDVSDIDAEIFQLTGKTFRSVGGISDIPTGKIRKNNAGVVERDYRDEGGFVPVGIKERADDVPAMLSKNEFVMTADAVRGIGNGSVEEGSKKLYNTMKQAEKVGKA